MTVSNLALNGLDPCVHCGFCLQACPTFLATGDEADGPRGRIVLMQALAHGTLHANDPGLTTHIDRCLGCRACETACPSGVTYGPALEETRRVIRTHRPLRADGLVTLAIMREPRLRTIILGLARLVRPLSRFLSGRSLLGFSMGMLASTKQSRFKEGPGANPPRTGTTEAFVTVFRGCIMDGLFDHVNRATTRVLKFNGCTHVDVPDQGCCGALHAHAGLMDEARQLARVNIKAFGAFQDATVVINSAGCGSALKEYGDWFQGLPEEHDAAQFSRRVKDVTEVLLQKGPRQGAALNLRVAYDPPCHLVHAQRIREAPIAVLRAVPGLDLIEHEGADDCCGSAGIYSLLERRMSQAVLAPKIEALIEVNPDIVVTGNPGCIMQIGAGLRAAGKRNIAVMHPVEILDRAYREADGYE